MTKPRILYHGSSTAITGKELIPKQSNDLGQNPENLIKGVYATDIKDLAIAMAIISSKGVNWSSLSFSKYEKGKSKSIIYKGYPLQKEIYLYHLPSTNFIQSKRIKHQFVSKNKVKPIKFEKLNIKDYKHLFKKATEKEIANWKKKYGEHQK